uniref:diphosphoinositol-polyphosphate diphosphatase n=1 Tax=Phallusia mammillata TaxID=59560 RepID=A0A6F9DM44_9ASCI|nr:diphosphoinositol polyphosphate phosphohydrolase 1-like [Phallusia mammillata]
MKIKINQVRTYDDAGFRRRAACLCFKAECETEVMLVTSSRYQHLWVVPGGGLEPGEDPETTAKREVEEEAGVVGELGRLLDVFENEERKTRTYVYVLIVKKLNDEYEDRKDIGRTRKWFSLVEALDKLSEHKPIQKRYLQKLINDQHHQQTAKNCAHRCFHENNSNLSIPKCLTPEAVINEKDGIVETELKDAMRNNTAATVRTVSPHIKSAFWKDIDSNLLPLTTEPCTKHQVINTS